MEQSQFTSMIASLHGAARERGLFFQLCEGVDGEKNTLTLGGRELAWFGSCSYLALDRHPALIAEAHACLDRYGTQFASSRGYVSAPPYAELEELLSTLFGGHALVGQTTTLAHMSFFDVLVSEKDAVVLDHQVHNSVHRAATLARAWGATIEIVKHDELEKAPDVVARLARKNKTVWFMCDGVTSMYGDLAPFGRLRQILAVAPNVRLYIDDSHGMSWAGRHGRGCFLDRFPLSPRVVVAASLAKAFAAGGGALVFASRRERERVRLCGSTMVFSGPLQPPLLGAAVASARVHLSEEIVQRQQALRERVRRLNRGLREAGLPLLVENDAPVFFIRLGLPEAAIEVAQRAARDGYYVNVSMFPAVPHRRAGLRLTLTAETGLAQIDGLVASLARHVPEVLERAGLSDARLDDLFGASVVGPGRRSTGASPLALRLADAPDAPETGLTVEHHRSIDAVHHDEWDSLLGTAANCSADSLKMQEQVFRGQPLAEHNWDFHYLIVRDRKGAVICATFLTTGICKDDMLMRAKISKRIEQQRETAPYYLTSRMLMVGSNFSEGNHLYIDRARPWRAGLHRLLRAVGEIFDAANAEVLIVRDLPADDGELERFLLPRGFTKVPNFSSNRLTIDWSDPQEYLNSLSGRARKVVRGVQANSGNFTVRLHGHGHPPLDAEADAHLHGLYLQVAQRNRRLNMFFIPPDLVAALTRSPAWEILTLTLDGGETPVAWGAAHRCRDHYAPLICGLDYAIPQHRGVYRQLLYQTVLRARELNARVVHLGMDADVEKRRLGARPRKMCLYVQARDAYNSVLMRSLVADIGLSPGKPRSMSPDP